MVVKMFWAERNTKELWNRSGESNIEVNLNETNLDLHAKVFILI